MRFSDLDGLTIGVWGAGVEARSFGRQVAARLPRARIAVLVREERRDARAERERKIEAPELTEHATIVGAEGAVEALRACDVLVRSPGVSIHRPELRALAGHGLPIVTPTGLWMEERGGRNVIGVTATKGKSTTASLIAHLVRKTGRPVQLGGNIGRPALDLLDTDERELAVIELSSYQIADLTAGPEVAMASNLYPEHLIWHLTMERYRAEKLRLLTLPGVRRCVLNAASPEVMAAPRAVDDVLLFGVPPGWHVTEEGDVARGHGEVHVRAGTLRLTGRHNALNVCGAATALEALDIPVPPLAGALADFEPLAHRLQVVHEAGGVTWVDDSISTEPYAARVAIESFPQRPVVLIGGGYDRGQDYAELAALLAERGADVLGLPATGSRLVEAALAAGVPAGRARMTEGLPEAVAVAREVAPAGAVVLLSPAAPSFTTHASYEARGDHFRDLARGG